MKAFGQGAGDEVSPGCLAGMNDGLMRNPDYKDQLRVEILKDRDAENPRTEFDHLGRILYIGNSRYRRFLLDNDPLHHLLCRVVWDNDWTLESIAFLDSTGESYLS